MMFPVCKKAKAIRFGLYFSFPLFFGRFFFPAVLL